MEKTLYVVDGFALIFRAYYAFIKRPLLNSRQQNTGAVFGFFRMLFRLIKEYRPGRLVVVFDGKKKSFRHELYTEYKANRTKAPEDLLDQIPWIISLVEEMGIPFLVADGVEADDVIAALAMQCRRQGTGCRIFSGDKDLMQLVGSCVEMLVSSSSGNELLLFQAEQVAEKFGVQPEQMADYLALVGDSSDNVPGVKGIGPKGAVKLLQEYGTLEGVYSHLTEIKPDGTRRKLEEFREDAELSYRLVKLTGDTPLPEISGHWSPETLARPEAVQRLQELELNSLLRDELLATDADSVEPAGLDEDGSAGGVTLDWVLVDSMEQLELLMQQLADAGSFAIDTETTSLNPLDAVLAGVSFSMEEGRGWYVPVAHRDSPLSTEAVLACMKPLLENPGLLKIGQNLKYDIRILAHAGIELAGIGFDTMVAAYLLEAGSGSGRVNLDALALRYLGHHMISYSDLVPDKEQTVLDIPVEKTAEYAAEDAAVTWMLYKKFQPMLEDEGLAGLFYELELPLVPVLAEMEENGVQLDAGHFATLSEGLEEELKVLTGRIHEIAGEEFNLNSPKQLSAILFEKLGIPPVKKTKTGFSTDEEVLQQLASDWEIAEALLTYRKLYKLKHTYLDVLPGLVHPATGRIHTSFNQTVTATGRLSSSDPNLQNIPIRDDLGRQVRKGFTAPPGRLLVNADYSQIELRILAAMSEDAALSEAYETGEDIHRRTAARIFDVAEAEVGREQRTFAKAINFGVIYGLSAYGLSRDLKIPRQQAQQYIDAWFRMHSGVSRFIDQTTAAAAESETVRTWFGRKRSLPEINSRNRMKRDASGRLAVNTRIQGTAADLMKKAMIGTYTALRERFPEAKLLLQVHDELLVEAPADQAEEVCQLLREQMAAPWPFDVPVEIGAGIGQNWDEAH